MNWAIKTDGPSAIWLIRLSVGTIFITEGIQKFLFAETLGAGRFEKIGIPMPHLLGPFVGTVEIIFGTLVAIGFATRLSALPLLVVIGTAILTTKIPMLLEKGFWVMAHESRTDYSMLLSLIFLIIVGSGSTSVDGYINRRNFKKKVPEV